MPSMLESEYILGVEGLPFVPPFSLDFIKRYVHINSDTAIIAQHLLPYIEIDVQMVDFPWGERSYQEVLQSIYLLECIYGCPWLPLVLPLYISSHWSCSTPSDSSYGGIKVG